jgi:NarL family two-component system response regulator LiaR
MTSEPTIRVLLVDDHEMVRQGLIYFLSTQPGIEIAGEAADGIEAVAAADALRPDVVLMDLVMPELDGVSAIKRIRERHPEIAILTLSSFADDVSIVKAIQAGAMGYVMKDISPRELANAIRTVAKGEVYLQPQVASRLAQGLRAESRSDRNTLLESLTEREHEVLCLVARGLSNQEIAETLCITVKTVKTHVSGVLSKLELDSRVQAALYALQHKIVCLDEV